MDTCPLRFRSKHCDVPRCSERHHHTLHDFRVPSLQPLALQQATDPLCQPTISNRSASSPSDEESYVSPKEILEDCQIRSEAHELQAGKSELSASVAKTGFSLSMNAGNNPENSGLSSPSIKNCSEMEDKDNISATRDPVIDLDQAYVPDPLQ